MSDDKRYAVIMTGAFLLALTIFAVGMTGCTTMTAACADGKSTVSYQGSNLLSAAPISASCLNTGNGPVVSITGTDLSQLAALVAQYLAATGGGVPVTPKPAPSAVPTP
jgi:hypothetical protein